ncbi:AraC family transcriptional regulator [Algoriphagus resistens]|uniref:AraC family transcriptional regulator n=1 Tax=Algoriphagus resistens TaxID=1750590 RepID=UPI000716A2E5|nr:AraC family transcriptional regulator [Algoriphagus resistens]
MKILALHLRSFLEFAHIRGINESTLLANMHFPPEDLSDPQAMVTFTDFYSVLDTMHRSLQDQQVGWRVGNFLNLNALGLIYQISIQTTTIEEAIFYLKDFLSATFPLIRLEQHSEADSHVLQLSIPNEKTILNRIILECLQVIIMRELSMMGDRDLSIQASSPHHDCSYPSCFIYGNTFQVIFSNLNLKASIKRFEQEQLAYLIPAYLKFIEGLKTEKDFQSKVKIAALQLAQPALPGLQEIADVFHLTPRTMQRMLAKEQLTFRKLLDGLKKQLGVVLLRHEGYSVTDVAYLLGYAEPASFIHAFKKWHGSPPTHIRSEVLNQ